MSRITWFALFVATLCCCSTSGGAAELKLQDVASATGDGPDRRGNTDDDTWQFWLELVHSKGNFIKLDRHSTKVPKGGIPGKVTGPIGSMLPNPRATKGWIYHSDWDGRFEGVWSDFKARKVLAYPYVEKNSHEAVAISYTVAVSGTYTISGGVTDGQVVAHPKHDGFIWKIEIADGGKKVKELGKGQPIGDKGGRPDSDKFKIEKVQLAKGQLLRLVIDPLNWWGTDLARIDYFRIEKVD